MSLPDDGNLCDTTIADNTDLGRNNIPGIMDSVLSSLHIGDEKYRIYSNKTEAATNITIHKITERIDSNIIFEVAGDKEAIHLLLNTKYIVIVVEPVFPIQNKQHSTSPVLCETIVRYYQHKIDAAT